MTSIPRRPVSYPGATVSGSMAYRLLALDLDGTLLRSDQRVDDRDIAAIAEVQAAGVIVTIVTGRLHSGSTEAARACAIDGAIACCDGSHLVEVATGRTLVHHGLTGDIAAVVRTAFASHGLPGFVFDATGIHHDDAGAPYAPYIRTWSPNLRVVEDGVAWETEPLGAIAVGDEAAVVAAQAALRDRAELFSVSFAIGQLSSYAVSPRADQPGAPAAAPPRGYPGKHALLVRAAGATKGTALVELCRLAGCSPAEAVAIGDWVNDVPMFEVAGRSFAMGSAPDHVRAKATDALSSTALAGGGIAEAVRRAFG